MENKPKLIAYLISVVAFIFSSSYSVSMEGVPQSQDVVPGEFVVKLKSQYVSQGTKVNSAQMMMNSLSSIGVENVEPFQTTDSFYLVKVKESLTLQNALTALNNNEYIEYAEPNAIFTIQITEDSDTPPAPTPPEEPRKGVPNDTDFGKLWGMENTGQKDSKNQEGIVGADINVVPAWAEGITGSKEILVAVIDTGIDWEHPDLKDNLFTNKNEIPDNGIDDDNNGFIDDIHGWNFVNNTNKSSDDHNHGTHCAGTIGGVGNNGEGVAGVAWNVTLLPVKFLSATGGGTLAAAIESINYARLMGVQIMSNSWGGGGFNASLKESIEAARDAGILFVAAAGNSYADNDKRPAYPASYDVENIVSVAAMDNQDKKAAFSNWGQTKVHVAAPGVNTYSTIRNGGYATYSGTSMAAPHVSGIATLMLSHDPSLDFNTIKNRLIKSSVPVENIKDKVVANGRVNAYNAIHGIETIVE